MMLRGRAIGGPRDGIILTAAESWDGTIALSDYVGKFKGVMYNGRYVWNNHKTAWVWSNNPPPPKNW